MGGNQSAETKDEAHGGAIQCCYYQQLGIDPGSSEDEIKKAYRRKALEFHPDRNYGNVVAATQKFADVQSAYEVLSDPQERAWYDDHKEAILSGHNAGTYDEHSIISTTAEEIYRFMTRFNKQTEYSDAPNGFYGAAEIFFDTIASEEKTACELEKTDVLEYPSFGLATSPYDDVVRPFYASWSAFTTKKSFAWKDIHRPSTAADRQLRRLMEKENRLNRDRGIREYNDAVRSLILFVRKRDPRFKANVQTEAQRQQVLKHAASAQAARSRAANEAKLSRQDLISGWAQLEGPLADVDDGSIEDDHGVTQELFECVVCDKTFKSEKQYEAHERSKKHVKLKRQLERQMGREDRELNLDTWLHRTASDDRLSNANTSDAGVDFHYHDFSDEPIDIDDSDSLKASRSAGLPERRACARVRDSLERLDLDLPPEKVATSSENSEQVKNLQIADSKECPSEEDSRSSDDVMSTSSHAGRRRSKPGKAKEKRIKKAAQKQRLNGASTM